MIIIRLLAEIDEASTDEEAQIILDAFRESVLPAENYGISLYREHLPSETPKPYQPNDGHAFLATRDPLGAGLCFACERPEHEHKGAKPCTN